MLFSVLSFIGNVLMALKFDTSAMETFVTALGENPIYNFRNADECIFYFCHRNEAFRTMEFVRKIQQRYREEVVGFSDEYSGNCGETKIIHAGIDKLLEEDYSDETAAENALVQYLVANHSRFIGYSKTAQQILKEELESDEVLFFDYDIIPERDKTGICPMRLHLYEDDHGRVTKRSMGYKGAGNEIYDILIDGIDSEEEEREPIDPKNLSMDSRVKDELLSGERLRKLLSGNPQKSISKKDFLLLRFYKLAYSVDFATISEKVHLAILREFQVGTNGMLQLVGLPSIYVGNPFDHLILTALCSKSPLDFVPKIFAAARSKVES